MDRRDEATIARAQAYREERRAIAPATGLEAATSFHPRLADASAAPPLCPPRLEVLDAQPPQPRPPLPDATLPAGASRPPWAAYVARVREYPTPITDLIPPGPLIDSPSLVRRCEMGVLRRPEWCSP